MVLLSERAQSAPQSAEYKKQFALNRWSDDVAFSPGGGPRHDAAVLAHDLDQAAAATRVEIVDLTPLDTPPLEPVILRTEVIFDATQGSATPGSIRLHPGGQSFVVRCNAQPHDVDPELPPVGYDPATGEDVWYFSLRDQPGSPLKDPIGSVFQYEATASPRSASDPTDVARNASVNISSHYSLFQGDLGYVHTIRIVE